MPASAKDVYRRYVVLTYLRPYTAIPFFLALFILLLYLLGKFMAIGIGRFFWGLFEQAIHRLPLVRSVYSAVKQVTDFFFRDQPSQFRRVVAVEYPRVGMWSVAFVTSDGFQDIRDSVGEPVVGLFIPTSPMPMNGYALTVRQSEVVDLRMTIDEAIQFIVSCGLVIPTQDLKRLQGDRGHAPPASSERDGNRPGALILPKQTRLVRLGTRASMLAQWQAEWVARSCGRPAWKWKWFP